MDMGKLACDHLAEPGQNLPQAWNSPAEGKAPNPTLDWGFIFFFLPWYTPLEEIATI